MDSTRITPCPTTVHVAIIGDGVTGLCMSLALSQRRISHQIFPSTCPESYGPIWTLGPNAMHALEIIHPSLEQEFWEHATGDLNPRRALWFSYRLGMTHLRSEEFRTVEGQIEPLPLIVDVEAHGPYAKGRGCIHQNDLSQQIRALNGEGEVWRHTVVEVREGDRGVELTMDDHSTVIADLVLACDGTDGPACRWLASLGPPPATPTPTPSGYSYHMMVPWHEAEVLLGPEVARNGNTFMGRRGYIVTSPVGYDGQCWLHVVAVRQLCDEDQAGSSQDHDYDPDELLQAFEGWAAPLRALLRRVKTPMRYAILDYQANFPRYRRRVCLLGEAAHPVTLHEHSTAGMNLEDVALMSRLLPTSHLNRPWKTPETIFQVFDTIRQNRTGRAMESARWAGRLLQFDHPDVGDNLDIISLNACHRWNWMWTYDGHWDLWRANDMLEQIRTVARSRRRAQTLIAQPDFPPVTDTECQHDYVELGPALTYRTPSLETSFLDSGTDFMDLDEWSGTFPEQL